MNPDLRLLACNSLAASAWTYGNRIVPDEEPQPTTGATVSPKPRHETFAISSSSMHIPEISKDDLKHKDRRPFYVRLGFKHRKHRR